MNLGSRQCSQHGFQLGLYLLVKFFDIAIVFKKLLLRPNMPISTHKKRFPVLTSEANVTYHNCSLFCFHFFL